MKIIGAGLSGLLAGCMFPGSTIYEKQDSLPHNHGAVLRFRSDVISKALGIPFKKVRVHKGIWFEGIGLTGLSITVQNLYSQKVTGEYTSRSISNIDPVDRWIAPPDFIEQLAERCNIRYGFVMGMAPKSPVISTIPMPMMGKIMDLPMMDQLEFKRRPIWTATYIFKRSVDLYQTIYFPGKETSMYRASFTGNKLMCEFVAAPKDGDVDSLYDAFGLVGAYNANPPTANKQEYGKIIEIDNNVRRSIMSQLTHEYGIYSLGRYATWRNILLDDVFQDIHRIRDMAKMDSYSRKMAIAEEERQ